MSLPGKLSEGFAKLVLWTAVMAFSLLAFIPNVHAGLKDNWIVQKVLCQDPKTQVPFTQKGHRLYFDFTGKVITLHLYLPKLPKNVDGKHADRLIAKIPFQLIEYQGTIELTPTGEVKCDLAWGTYTKAIRCPNQVDTEFAKKFFIRGTYSHSPSGVLHLIGAFSTEIIACNQGNSLVPIHGLGLVNVLN